MNAAERLIAEDVERRGFRPGTSLENRATRFLAIAGHVPEQLKQQYRVGVYRLDFAWPELGVALEVDGWHHGEPARAARDAVRDRWLRQRGWLVLRVHEVVDDDLAFRTMLSRVSELAYALDPR